MDHDFNLSMLYASIEQFSVGFFDLKEIDAAIAAKFRSLRDRSYPLLAEQNQITETMRWQLNQMCLMSFVRSINF